MEPLVRVSSVDEDDVVATAEAGLGRLAAADVALLLARAKAEDVVTGLEHDASDGDHGGGEVEGDGVGEAVDDGVRRDDVDDVDNEDGAVMEEDELDTDLTLRAVDPADVTGPTGTIARDDDELDPPDPGMRI